MRKELRRDKFLVFGAMSAFVILAVLAILIFQHLISQKPASRPTYWPTKGWRSSAPEEHGIDSSKLAEGLQTIREREIDIHSLLIIRNGMVVLDASFYPYDGKTVHDMASVTKSIMTTLVGIAADQGKLELDQPVVSFFPESTIANLDDRKKSITVRHLASMSSGLDSMGLEDDEGTLREMQASEDWVQFALDRKVVSQPGTIFVYDSPGMHLLSAILQQATGMTALEFARQNLFEPLGINDVIWPADPQGFSRGWGDLYLHPRDAAKIGYLWLNRGVWEGDQIVSREWVENSVKTQIKTGMDDDYGYGWWTMSGPAGGGFAAIGRGGQRMQVVPALDIIVVTTGGGFDIDEIMPLLVPALADSSSPSPEGMAELDETLAQILQPPTPKAVEPLSDMAKEISGKTYELDTNRLELKTWRIDFNGSDEAILYITFTDDSPSPPRLVGLDGVYRMSQGEYNLPLGIRGYWADERAFVLEYDEIAANNHFVFRMVFKDGKVIMKGQETAHELGVTIEGRLQSP